MRNNHYTRLARPERDQGLNQLPLTGGIEMGVGLVKQDNRRVSIQSSRKAYALRLACREPATAPAERRQVMRDEQGRERRAIACGDVAKRQCQVGTELQISDNRRPLQLRSRPRP